MGAWGRCKLKLPALLPLLCSFLSVASACYPESRRPLCSLALLPRVLASDMTFLGARRGTSVAAGLSRSNRGLNVSELEPAKAESCIAGHLVPSYLRFTPTGQALLAHCTLEPFRGTGSAGSSSFHAMHIS